MPGFDCASSSVKSSSEVKALDCRQFILQLSNYLDGELDSSLQADLERHLQKCPDCRMVVNTTKKTIDIFCHCAPAPLPEDVRTRLHRALEAHLKRQPH